MGMTHQYDLFKAELLHLFPYCEYCNYQPATEAHHVLYHRMKGRPELDCLENCAAVCHECHMDGKVNSWDFQVHHWQKRSRQFNMAEWNDNLELKVKESWE
jgi:hypothetical protein